MDKTYTAVSRILHKFHKYRDRPHVRELMLFCMGMYPHAKTQKDFPEAVKSLILSNREYDFLSTYSQSVLKGFRDEDIKFVFSEIQSAFDEGIVKYYAFEVLRDRFSPRKSFSLGFNTSFIFNILKEFNISDKSSISDISGKGIFIKPIAGMLRKKGHDTPKLMAYPKHESFRFDILCNMAMNNYMNFTITDTPVYEAQLLIVFPMITHRKIIINKKFINKMIENFNNGDELLILDTFSLLTSERGRYVREQLLDNNLLKAAISAGRGCMRNSGMELGILHIGENDSRKIEIAHYERMHKSLRRREKSVPVKQIKEKDFNLHYRHYLKVQQENSISAGELLEDIRENGMKIDEFIKKAYREISNI